MHTHAHVHTDTHTEKKKKIGSVVENLLSIRKTLNSIVTIQKIKYSFDVSIFLH